MELRHEKMDFATDDLSPSSFEIMKIKDEKMDFVTDGADLSPSQIMEIKAEKMDVANQPDDVSATTDSKNENENNCLSTAIPTPSNGLFAPVITQASTIADDSTMASMTSLQTPSELKDEITIDEQEFPEGKYEPDEEMPPKAVTSSNSVPIISVKPPSKLFNLKDEITVKSEKQEVPETKYTPSEEMTREAVSSGNSVSTVPQESPSGLLKVKDEITVKSEKQEVIETKYKPKEEITREAVSSGNSVSTVPTVPQESPSGLLKVKDEITVKSEKQEVIETKYKPKEEITPEARSGNSTSTISVEPPSKMLKLKDEITTVERGEPMDIEEKYEPGRRMTPRAASSGNRENFIGVKKEEKVRPEENTNELSVNPVETMPTYSTVNENGYPYISRINAVLEEIPVIGEEEILDTVEPDQDHPLPNLPNSSGDPRLRRKKPNVFPDKPRKSLPEAIREVDLLLAHCSNAEQRRNLLMKKKKLEEMLQYLRENADAHKNNFTQHAQDGYRGANRMRGRFNRVRTTISHPNDSTSYGQNGYTDTNRMEGRFNRTEMTISHPNDSTRYGQNGYTDANRREGRFSRTETTFSHPNDSTRYGQNGYPDTNRMERRFNRTETFNQIETTNARPNNFTRYARNGYKNTRRMDRRFNRTEMFNQVETTNYTEQSNRVGTFNTAAGTHRMGDSSLVEISRRTKIVTSITEISDRQEISKPESDDNMFVTFHDNLFVDVEDGPDDEEVCECTQKNVSEVEVRLKNELKRLQEQFSCAHDLRKEWLEPKMNKLREHLSQPHICDKRPANIKCRWCADPKNYISIKGKEVTSFCETKKFERQLDRLKLLFSIHRDKGEDEKWLMFKIKETEHHLSQLARCCGRPKLSHNAASEVVVIEDDSPPPTPAIKPVATPSHDPAKPSHDFFCSCFNCSREHRSFLAQLKKLTEKPKKK